MSKRILLFLLSSFVLQLTLKAQVETNAPLLKSAAIERKIAEDSNYNKALITAKQKGWKLVLNEKNDSKAYLMGTYADGTPKYLTTFNNTIAAATTRASQLWPGGASGLNLSGSSANMKNKLAVWDGAKPLATHVELVGRITQKDAPSSTIDHTTHVTGTMIASGVNPIAKGMAYGLQGILAYDYNNDVSEITAEAANLVLSNHSYGAVCGWYNNSGNWEFYGRATDTADYKFGYYDSEAQLLDDIAYNAPNYLIVRAAGNNRNVNGPAVGGSYYRYDANNVMNFAGARPAGISNNDGYDILPTAACAKNILTVGAVGGIATGYTKASDVVMSSFSSWGPTDDGRIKPDIVADGVSVTSCVATSTTAYASSSGTSMATPNATGSLLLLQEYYAQLKGGGSNFMRSATLKGLAIHTADEAGTTAGPDYKFGWGLLNVQKAAEVIKGAIPSNNSSTSTHLIYENTLSNGGTFTLPVIANSTGTLVATLCWTDVKGTVETSNVLNNRTKKLVNDLDVRITNGTTVYKPWVLDPLVPSAAATKGDNITDNVERINIDTAIKGQTYTITVSHKGSLQKGSQAYSLIVSGAGGSLYDDNTFIVSPNPSNGNFRIFYKADTNADLIVSITDLSGNTIFAKSYPNFIGTYIEDVSKKYLQFGYYVVKIVHGSHVDFRKVLITH